MPPQALPLRLLQIRQYCAHNIVAFLPYVSEALRHACEYSSWFLQSGVHFFLLHDNACCSATFQGRMLHTASVRRFAGHIEYFILINFNCSGEEGILAPRNAYASAFNQTLRVLPANLVCVADGKRHQLLFLLLKTSIRSGRWNI